MPRQHQTEFEKFLRRRDCQGLLSRLIDKLNKKDYEKLLAEVQRYSEDRLEDVTA